jgi:hypothetical protein
VPTWGERAEWDQAYEKLESCLRAYRLHGKWHRAHLTQQILRRLAARPPPEPRAPLTALAIDTLDAELDGWLRRILPETAELLPRQRLAAGRLALLLCDAYARWPDAFLSERPPPEEMQRALHGAMLRAGPEVLKGRMVPQARGLGWMAEWAGGALDTFDRWPILKTLLGWLLAGALFAYLFHITR